MRLERNLTKKEAKNVHLNCYLKCDLKDVKNSHFDFGSILRIDVEDDYSLEDW